MISQRLTLILEAELMPGEQRLFLEILQKRPSLQHPRDKTIFLNVLLPDNGSLINTAERATCKRRGNSMPRRCFCKRASLA